MALTTIYIDNKPYEVNSEANVLEACLSLGMDLPYFCWHPALGSVGACRQCAVKQFRDEKDTRGKLVMSCLTEITKNLRISIEDPEARTFRAAVIEGLMESHPHDCPVCDEGGECHLQDMTVMTGHDYRRYSFSKRTFRNQYLGPFVNQEMNRCIQCYRCVRFYREYAGGTDFDNFGIRNLVFFGRAKEGVLENEFAGNLVEVCPTGVFTDKTLKQHYTRKWDLQFAPSICAHCSTGCNTSPGERYGMLRRIVNRYNGEVNGYFLCDRGRFGYEFVNSSKRMRTGQVRRGGALESATKAEVLEKAGQLLAPGLNLIGIGSPRAPLEANFALRELVGEERFFAGVAGTEGHLIERIVGLLESSAGSIASIRDIEHSDAVLVLGEDLTNTAPRMALAMRQAVRVRPFEQIAVKLKLPAWNDHAVREAVQDSTGPLFLATVSATKLDDIATETYRAAPDDIARLGFAVAHALDAQAPEAADLSSEARALAARIASRLKEAHDPLVIAGVSLSNEATLDAAASVWRALKQLGRSARVSFVVPEANSIGLGLMRPRSLESAAELAKRGGVNTIVVLENDLYRRASRKAIDEFLSAAQHVVVIDSISTPTCERAELVLPAGTFAESDGTFVNNEGRAQRLFEVFVPADGIGPSWRWIREAMIAAGRKEARAWTDLDDVLATFAHAFPDYAAVRDAAPPSNFRVAQQKVAREPHRSSGRTAMFADIAIHEPKPPDDPDSALAFSMEGYTPQPPPALTPYFWTPGWNSIQAVNKFQQEIAGPLRGGDPGVRLFEKGKQNGHVYAQAVPAAFAPRSGEHLLVPAYHIFGSEELSRLAPGVAELSPKPYVGIGAEDAQQIGTKTESLARVSVDRATYDLPIRIISGLPRGVAVLPVGFGVADGALLPAWGRISTAQ